jgi:hypothetical protein
MAPHDVAHVTVRQVACDVVEVVEHREHPRGGRQMEGQSPTSPIF